MLAFILSAAVFTQCEECPPAPWKVAVFELSGVGIEKDLATTISDLLRVELAECEKFSVIDKGTMINILGEDLTVVSMEKAIGHSESLGVSLAVMGHMTKLGGKIIISVSAINRWRKERVYSDKLTSTSIEDLDIVIKRLAKSLCEMRKAKESVTIETITEEEAKPRRRRESYHSGGLLLGYLFPLGGSYGRKIEEDSLGGEVKDMIGANFLYFYETPYYALEVSYKGYKRSWSTNWGIGFSGYRFLSLTDFSPFIGGGFGIGWGSRGIGIDTIGYSVYDSDTIWYCRGEAEGYDGLSINLGGGMILWRTYDFHFIVNLGYQIILGKGVPHGFVFSFGATYKKTGTGCGCVF